MKKAVDQARANLVAVNALSQVIGGGISVARDLVTALARERPTARFAFYCSAPELSAVHYPINVEVSYHPELRAVVRRSLWEQIALPWILRQRPFDVLLALGGFSVVATAVPQLAVWQNPNIITRIAVPRPWRVQAYIALQRIVQRASMRKASLNVFLTRESVREAATRWPMAEIPHVVIHNGIATPPAPASTLSAAPDEPPFVLAVGHSYFHKNYEALIDAMACYREGYDDGLTLRIAGGAVDAAYHRELENRIRSRGLDAVVRFLGPTPAPEVAALYQRAKGFVITSVLESFGLTPLEAMSHGVPVLAARASCIPEVCGDAALYCDPHDPVDIARRLREIVTDEDLRRTLRERGRRRVSAFTWNDRAREYLAALDACLDPRGAELPSAANPGR